MGFRFRKSKNFGPFRVNVSKSGIGWSVGAKGARYTKRADGKTQTTLNIPGTGISYVDVHGSNNKNSKSEYSALQNNNLISNGNNNNKKDPFFKRKWFMWVMMFTLPPIGLILMWLYSGYKILPKVLLTLFFGFISIRAYSGLGTQENSVTSTNQNVAVQDQQDSSIDNSNTEIVEAPKLIGWQNINNKTYYYDDNGIPKTGWIEDNGKYYYCDSSGLMKIGWIEDNNNYYYCSANGSMQTGWVQDNNNWYYLNTDGTMAKNITKDGYTINSTGVATKEIIQSETTDDSKSNSSTSTYKSSNSNSSGTTTYEPASGERTVYWTPNGKSYHYRQSCPTLSRSKNIKSGSASNCPKSDPCDKCAK